MSESGTVGLPADPDEERAYLARVMAEIDEEVRVRRASGDLPARVERELDELFLEHSPVAGRAGSLRDALRMVDAATFIDPVVPVASSKSGGAVVKRGLRQLSLWYVGYVTHQVSQFASAVSRSLHLLGDEVRSAQRQLDAQRIPPAPVVAVDWAHRTDAWWVAPALGALGKVTGRVLHSASGDGWLVRACAERGIDAYGVDPRPGTEEVGTEGALDLRGEPLSDHLEATGSAALGGLVLSGTVEAMAPGERERFLALAADRLAPGGTLVLHSLSPSAWGSGELPVEADLAFGHPLRPRTWDHELTRRGFDVHVDEGRDGRDYLVVATLPASAPSPR